MDEADLIRRLKDGTTKHDAFRTLVRRYKEPLYRFVRKIVIDHHDTDDIVQLTFIKVFKYVDGFNSQSKLQTWMMTIARREAYGFMEKESRKTHQSIEEMSVNRMELIEAGTEFYTGDEIQLKLQKNVAKLPQKQREVFNMKYFDKLKYKDISEITGTSEGGLKANYFLAVKRLKELLLEP